MTITIRKSARKAGSTERAVAWMKRKYPDVDFSKVEIILGKGTRCRYFRNESGKFDHPTVFISTNHFDLCVYNMKSLGIKKTCVYAGYDAVIESGIVHELTHHVQYEKGLSTGELLTTSNELEFLSEYYPDIYRKFFKK